MEILFVTGRLYPWNSGGTGNVQLNLVNSLVTKPDVKVSLLGTYTGNFVFVKEIYRNHMIIPVKTFGDNDSLNDITISNFMYPIRMLQRRFDIVHFNIMPGLRAYTSFRLARWMGKKMIVNIHGPPREIYYYSKSDSVKNVAKLHWLLSLHALAEADSIIVVNSSYMRQEIITLLPDAKIEIIPNGIDSYLLDLPETPGNSRTILCFGNLAKIKGQDLLIKAFALSNAKNQYKLLLVGRIVSNEYYHLLVRQIRESGLEQIVKIIGPVTRNKLLETIRQSEFCVFPSLIEPFGIAILEAMALGKAVVATRSGGPVDFIENGENGILVNPGDLHQLVEAINSLCFNSELLSKLGRNARTKAKRYTWNAVSDLYVELYKKIL